jgi:UDP-glucose 4-epimerase
MNKINVAVVTGGAGFIGSNLVDSLLSQRVEVRVIDNFTSGRSEFIESALKNPNFKVFEDDLLTSTRLGSYFENADAVFHLSANADVRFGPDHPARDLEQNTIVTQRVLEATRLARVSKFIFSSTGSVYGEAEIVPTPENAPFPIQTSLYGASKIAGEGLVSAYAEAFGMQAWIFRFVSILGPRYTHGHVIDFYRQLHANPNVLKVLGDGHQKKSYLHVQDCINAINIAINIAINNSKEKVNVLNLGVDGFCEVRDSIGWIIDELKLSPKIEYGRESRGWIGDNPLIHLKNNKMSSLGWSPSFSIEVAVRDTVNFLKSNSWVLRT